MNRHYEERIGHVDENVFLSEKVSHAKVVVIATTCFYRKQSIKKSQFSTTEAICPTIIHSTRWQQLFGQSLLFVSLSRTGLWSLLVWLFWRCTSGG